MVKRVSVLGSALSFIAFSGTAPVTDISNNQNNAGYIAGVIL